MQRPGECCWLGFFCGRGGLLNLFLMAVTFAAEIVTWKSVLVGRGLHFFAFPVCVVGGGVDQPSKENWGDKDGLKRILSKSYFVSNNDTQNSPLSI